MNPTNIMDADLRDAIQRASAAAAAGDHYVAALALNNATQRAYAIAHSANFAAGMDAGERIYKRPSAFEEMMA